MAKRFADLKKALKLSRSLTAPGTPVTAPAGSALEKFQEFQNGTTVITVNRAADSLPKTVGLVDINPFGSELIPGNLVAVKISERAETSIFSNLKAICGHTDHVESTSKAVGFVPAKAIIAVPATSATPEFSNITGLPYKTKKAKSYTFPYGQITSQTRESDTRTAILASVKTTSPTAKISFNSEEL